MKRVLCIDDDMIILECLVEELKRSGLKVECETATSFEQVLEIVEYYQENNMIFDYIICDYIMPKIKGDYVLKYLNNIYPASKKILLSGQIEIEKIIDLKEKVANIEYFQKPWKNNMIEKFIRGE